MDALPPPQAQPSTTELLFEPPPHAACDAVASAQPAHTAEALAYRELMDGLEHLEHLSRYTVRTADTLTALCACRSLPALMHVVLSATDSGSNKQFAKSTVARRVAVLGQAKKLNNRAGSPAASGLLYTMALANPTNARDAKNLDDWLDGLPDAFPEALLPYRDHILVKGAIALNERERDARARGKPAMADRYARLRARLDSYREQVEAMLAQSFVPEDTEVVAIGCKMRTEYEATQRQTRKHQHQVSLSPPVDLTSPQEPAVPPLPHAVVRAYTVPSQRWQPVTVQDPTWQPVTAQNPTWQPVTVEQPPGLAHTPFQWAVTKTLFAREQQADIETAPLQLVWYRTLHDAQSVDSLGQAFAAMAQASQQALAKVLAEIGGGSSRHPAAAELALAILLASPATLDPALQRAITQALDRVEAWPASATTDLQALLAAAARHPLCERSLEALINRQLSH